MCTSSHCPESLRASVCLLATAVPRSPDCICARAIVSNGYQVWAVAVRPAQRGMSIVFWQSTQIGKQTQTCVRTNRIRWHSDRCTMQFLLFVFIQLNAFQLHAAFRLPFTFGRCPECVRPASHALCSDKVRCPRWTRAVRCDLSYSYWPPSDANAPTDDRTAFACMETKYSKATYTQLTCDDLQQRQRRRRQHDMQWFSNWRRRRRRAIAGWPSPSARSLARTIWWSGCSRASHSFVCVCVCTHMPGYVTCTDTHTAARTTTSWSARARVPSERFIHIAGWNAARGEGRTLPVGMDACVSMCVQWNSCWTQSQRDADDISWPESSAIALCNVLHRSRDLFCGVCTLDNWFLNGLRSF